MSTSEQNAEDLYIGLGALAPVLATLSLVDREGLANGAILFLPPDLLPKVTSVYGIRVIRHDAIAEPYVALTGYRPGR